MRSGAMGRRVVTGEAFDCVFGRSTKSLNAGTPAKGGFAGPARIAAFWSMTGRCPRWAHKGAILRLSKKSSLSQLEKPNRS